MPTNACGATAPLLGVNQMNASVVSYAGQIPAVGSSVARTNDGSSTWLSQAATLGSCNGVCQTSNSFQLNAQVSAVTCNLQDGSISFAPSPAGTYTYQWNPAVSTTSSASGLGAGSYQITINDGSCTKDTTITLTAPDCGCADPFTVSVSSQPNSACNSGGGDPCAYNGPLLRINELLIQPNGTNTLWSPFGVGSEWIELYNPHPCNPIDISCWVLGANGFVAGQAGSSAYGTIVIPAGTIIPPLSTFTIGGNGITASLSVSNTAVRCGNINGQNAFQLDNTVGHLLLFQPNGQFVDGVYWGANQNVLSNPDFQLNLACLPTNAAACGIADLSIFQAPSQLLDAADYLGVPSSNRIYFRNETGSWATVVGAGTPNACNVPGSCVPTAVSTCSGSATVVVTGNSSSYTYLWNDPQAQTTAQAVGLCAGNYCVTVTDASGDCVEIICVDVVDEGDFEVEVTVQQPTCGGTDGSISLLENPAGVYTYAWTPIVSTSNTASNLAAGTYEVVVTSGGCSVTETITLSSANGPSSVELALSNPACGNANGEIEVVTVAGGTAPYQFSLNNGPFVLTQTYQNLESGAYELVIRDANGCEYIETNIVLTGGTALTDLTYEVTNGSCTNTFGSLQMLGVAGGTAPYTYSLNGQNSTTGNYTDLTSGLYTLLVTDSEGCSFSETFSITAGSAPTASFDVVPGIVSTNNSTVFCSNTSSQDVVSYQWFSPFGSPLLGSLEEFSTTFSELEQGYYPITLVVTNAQGCTDTATVFIEVYDEILLFAPNTFTPDGDEFNNTWNVYFSNIDVTSFELRIYNRWGELIFESYDVDLGWDGTYNGVLAKSDIYVWDIRVKETQTDKKQSFTGHITLMR
jgi:gliding motility-associated-like protein